MYIFCAVDHEPEVTLQTTMSAMPPPFRSQSPCRIVHRNELCSVRITLLKYCSLGKLQLLSAMNLWSSTTLQCRLFFDSANETSSNCLLFKWEVTVVYPCTAHSVFSPWKCAIFLMAWTCFGNSELWINSYRSLLLSENDLGIDFCSVEETQSIINMLAKNNKLISVFF